MSPAARDDRKTCNDGRRAFIVKSPKVAI